MVVNREIIFRSILLLLFIITIVTPFNVDVFVSFASAFQADYLGSFPENIYSSWNLRGIGYKIIIYILYKLFAFVSPESFLFIVMVKSFYYLFFLSLTYLFLYLIKKPLLSFNIFHKNVFYIFSIGILTTSHYIHLQAEELSLFFCVGMIAFSLSDNKNLNLLAGIFIPVLLSLKLVTVSYAAFPALVVLFLYYNNSDKGKIFRFIASSIIFSLLTVLFYCFFIPQEINDTVNATYFQDSFQFTIKSTYIFVWSIIARMSHIPLMLVTIFLFLKLFIHIKWDLKRLLFLILLVLPAALSIMAQGRYFHYHYTIFIILTTILYGMLSMLKVKIRINVIYYSLFTLALFYKFVPGEIPKIKETSANYFYHKIHYYDILIYVGSELETKYSGQQDILFLTDGAINYYFRDKSYLRYFFPLPVQRTDKVESVEKLKNQDVYKETLSKILNYKGEIILLQPEWFELDKHPLIKNKIESDYILLDEYMADTKGNLNYELYIKGR